MTDYLTDFVQESEERITELNNALLTLERDPTDAEAMENIFRIAHTLKGNCGAMGFTPASDLAHALEDLLDAVRTGDRDVTPELMDVIFDAVDELETMIDEVEARGEIETDPSATIAALRNQLEAADGSISTPTTAEIDAVIDRFDPPAADEHDAYLVRLDIADREDVNNGALVITALIDAFDLIGTDPPRERIEAGDYDGRYDAVFGSAVGKAAIESGLEPVEEVADFELVEVTDRFAAVDSARETDTGADAGDGISPEDAAELEVDDLLDEFDEFDDLDEQVEEIDDDELEPFEDMGEAGSFDDLLDDDLEEEPGEPLADDEAAADASPSSADDDTDDVEDATAVFNELKDEVDMVGFDELQSELEELEFDEFDEDDEVDMDELIGDDAAADEPFLPEAEATDDDIDDAVAEADEDEPADESAAESVESDEVAESVESDDTVESVEPDEDTEPAVDNDPATEPTAASDEDTADEPTAASTDADDGQPVAEPDPADGDSGLEADDPLETSGPVSESAVAEASPESAAGDSDETVGDEPDDDSAAADELEEIEETTTDEGDETPDDGIDEAVVDEPVADDLEETVADDGLEETVADDGLEETVTDDDPESTVDEADAETDLEADATDDSGTALGFGDTDESLATDPAADSFDEEGDDDPFADESIDEDLTFGADDDPFDDTTVDGFDDTDDVFEDDTLEDSFADDEFGTDEFASEADGSDAEPSTSSSTDAAGFDDATDDGDDETDVVRRVDEPTLASPELSLSETTDRLDTDQQTDEIQSVRVDVEQIDSLLTLVEGLVTTRVRLRHAVTEHENDDALETELDELEDLTTDLQETVMDIRLVPLRTVASRLPRVVRDVARDQDKEVTFEMTGEDVEIDRSILDRIGDPLIHLVRNAVDHGIEPPDERERAEKPRDGTVEVHADRSRDRVTITVTDDGSGLDPDRLRSEAVEADVLTDEEAAELSDEDAYDLIFHPGLSTADEVSDVSGRGVGMDVVKRTVEGLEGTVEIDSDVGDGTAVTMTLPVSVAIDDILFLESGGAEFGVPTKVVEDIEPADRLETADGRLALTDGDDAYSVIQLDEMLETPRHGANGDGMVVRIRDEVRPVALHCDHVHGQQEVVVKPFEGFMSDIPGLSGATVRGRGEVVNILDVTTL